MSKNSEAVKRWRENTKQRIIMSLGGKCVCCNYNRCSRAMDCHHLYSGEKEHRISDMLVNAKSWSVIADELRKCVLVCCRCHAEIHDGIIFVPDNAVRFDEWYANYKKTIRGIDTPCRVCGKNKQSYLVTCSRSCAAKLSRTVDWSKIDLAEVSKTKTVQEMADIMNVSDNAVRKRMMKMGIYCPVAQSVERLSVKQEVVGSIPTRTAI